MIPWTDVMWLVVGFVAVTIGADVFVSGASGIARRFGISPLLVGLTIVALGTSAPEVAVNVTAALRGQTDMAIGNVLGSNILNILGVLGLCAVLRSIVVAAQLVKLDVPVMVGAALLLSWFAWDGRVAPREAAVLVAVLVTYTVIQVGLALRARRNRDEEQAEDDAGLWTRIGQLGLGVALLVVGSDRLVLGATGLAQWWGLSELVVGLTVIAVGTSLPEIATSVAATLRGHGELAVGNVVGSNIYNILAVVGLTGMVAKGGLPVGAAALVFDLPVMVTACVACLPIFVTDGRIDRWEGGLFVAYYLAYLAYLLLATQQHSLAEPFGAVMLYFVGPLTAVTLVACVIGYWRQRRKEARAVREASSVADDPEPRNASSG